ncbi:hypothetical protein ScPMuIL_007444 [Solemya velum]
MAERFMETPTGFPQVLIKGHKMDENEMHRSLLDMRPNGQAQVVIERPIYSQKRFDEGFEGGYRPTYTVRDMVRQKVNKMECSKKCTTGFIYMVFPFLRILKGYSVRSDLMNDIVSGLTVGIMHIPQGMAYGSLAGLPPVYGLYTSFFPVIVYFFFGSSRHISIGTFAVASLMIQTVTMKADDMYQPTNNVTVVNITNNNQSMSSTEAMFDPMFEMKFELAMAVTFAVGVLQILMGLLRLGFVTIYLSDPLISGFTTGCACHVFTSQIQHVFGIKAGTYQGPFKLLYVYRDFFSKLAMTNAITLIASVVGIIVLYCTKEYINNNPKLKPRMIMPVPIELIVVVLGTLSSFLLDLDSVYHVKIVGDIPKGLPSPQIRQFNLLGDVLGDAFAIAIVTFAISVSMAKILAKRHEYDINSNQELVALGVSNVIASFFASYVASASLSRSLVQDNVGGKTQVAGLVSSVLLLVVLLVLAPYFRTLPKCFLAAIIIVALKGMFRQIFELPRLWKVSKFDFSVWVVTLMATVLLDVDYGLLVGVLFSFVTIIYRNQRPYVCQMGHMPGTDFYKDISVYKEALILPGIRIIRFENSLFSINVEHFRNNLYKNTTNPKKLKLAIKKAKSRHAKQMKAEKNAQSKEKEMTDVVIGDEIENNLSYIHTPVPKAPFHTIILDCSSWGFMDAMSVKALQTIMTEYKAVDVSIYLALCKAGIREMFERTGFYDLIDRDVMFCTIHDAVLEAQQKHEMPNMEELMAETEFVIETNFQTDKKIILNEENDFDGTEDQNGKHVDSDHDDGHDNVAPIVGPEDSDV